MPPIGDAAPPRAPAWQRAVRRLAMLPPVSWAMRLMLHRADWMVHRMTDGAHTAASVLTGVPTAMVTTTGARTGRPRTVPLVVLPTDRGVAVVGSNYGRPHDPGWVHNLRAHPRGHVSSDGGWDFVAIEVDGVQRSELWDGFVTAWRGYADYERRAAPRRIALFELVRTETDGADG
jgi:deazaflavin-dependent oxidoreductase (nitroreductase family)